MIEMDIIFTFFLFRVFVLISVLYITFKSNRFGNNGFSIFSFFHFCRLNIFFYYSSLRISLDSAKEISKEILDVGGIEINLIGRGFFINQKKGMISWIVVRFTILNYI
jgi:hypothetical protein